MRVVIDMNLSPEWVAVLKKHGFEVTHWQEIGPKNALDTEILTWAGSHDHIVFTNDLDFGRLLALTYARGPSVLQIRGGAVLPEDTADSVLDALTQCKEELRTGALVTVDEGSRRVRILPIK
jgi:predicted nuclease of predicted toxin-antitoxin system